MFNITTEQMRFWSPEVRELEPYVPGEQPKIQNLLKLNTNENPYPPSPKVVEAVQAVLVNSADVLRLYPDPDAAALKQAIAKQQNVVVENVFVGNGSDEVLAHIFKAFFVQELPLLYPDITYSFYPVYSQFFGVKTKILPLNDDFEIVVDDYKQANGGIIITNPNAPTSIDIGLAAIEEVLQANPNSVVVIDEAYVDFGAESAVSLVEKYELRLHLNHCRQKYFQPQHFVVSQSPALTQKHLDLDINAIHLQSFPKLLEQPPPLLVRVDMDFRWY